MNKFWFSLIVSTVRVVFTIVSGALKLCLVEALGNFGGVTVQGNTSGRVWASCACAAGRGAGPANATTFLCSYRPVLHFCLAGDEMFSDIYKIKESPNGILYEVEGKVSLLWSFLLYSLCSYELTNTGMFTQSDVALRACQGSDAIIDFFFLWTIVPWCVQDVPLGVPHVAGVYMMSFLQMVSRTEDIDDALIGGNASAEAADEGCDSTTVSGVDIVLNHKLQETSFTKDTYKAYIKDYMKA